jgi:hypothetical protein
VNIWENVKCVGRECEDFQVHNNSEHEWGWEGVRWCGEGVRGCGEMVWGCGVGVRGCGEGVRGCGKGGGGRWERKGYG